MSCLFCGGGHCGSSAGGRDQCAESEQAANDRAWDARQKRIAESTWDGYYAGETPYEYDNS